MHREVAWLQGELPDLVERGVLSAEAAEALRRHYAGAGNGPSRSRWGQVLLASFGALLVGGGLILILAHNWDALGRPARAAIAIGTLLIAQTLSLFAVARRRESMVWIEATSALLVAAVGAALALVGQTYHLGGSFERLMQAWLWLVVPIPYLTGSILASAGFWSLLVVRLMGGGSREAAIDPWLLILAAAPFVALRARHEPRSWATALVVIAGAAGTLIAGTVQALGSRWSGLWAVFQVPLLSAFLAAASWPIGRRTRERWRGWLFGGAWLLLIVTGTILSFEDGWRSIADRDRLRNAADAMPAVIGLAAAALAALAGGRLFRAGERGIAVTTWAGALVIVMHGLGRLGAEPLGWIAFNLWLFAAGALTLGEGVRRLELGAANRGLLMLAALVIVRFFDTDLSFLARGLAFVALGAGCFGLNVWLMRRARGRMP
jgi:uncharacterized membrane protein